MSKFFKKETFHSISIRYLNINVILAELEIFCISWSPSLLVAKGAQINQTLWVSNAETGKFQQSQ